MKKLLRELPAATKVAIGKTPTGVNRPMGVTIGKTPIEIYSSCGSRLQIAPKKSCLQIVLMGAAFGLLLWELPYDCSYGSCL